MGGESQQAVTAPPEAVFISYASEDCAAARRICEAVRAAGVEVWFDQTELRGGDAWDRHIREGIYNCRLFIPVISANTESRDEGYFRREWKLAADRTHDMAEQRPFLVPVVIDGTRQRGASVPDKFQAVQWTRLPAGETSPAFVELIMRLLRRVSPASTHISSESRPQTVAPSGSASRLPQGLDRTVTGGGEAKLACHHGHRARYRVSRAKVGILAALLIIPCTLLWRASRPGSPRTTLPTASAFMPSPHSIAVLPLVNESGDPNQQYFSDGLSEDLINALAQFPGLRVIGRHSSFQFRNPTDDSKTIGLKLGVAYLLEGSVRRQGATVRVSAELIDSSDGTLQWSEHYDRPYTDLFALQDDITRAVAAALKTRLGNNTLAQNDRPPSGNLEAYSAYLQGSSLMDSLHDEVDYRKAIDAFTTAARLDPGYARAWSALSIVWTDLGGDYLTGTASQEAYANARRAADVALRLQPDLAAAHVARGWLFAAADLDEQAAEREYRRAIELAPQDGLSKYFLASQMAILGQLRPAVDLMRQALAGDPLHALWYRWLAMYLRGLNQLDDARQAIRKASELQPTLTGLHEVLTLIEVQSGNAKVALAAAEEVPAGYQRDASTTLALQIGNDRARADDALKRLIAQYSDVTGMAYDVAQIYALRKDANRTFEWLDRAWRNHDEVNIFLLYDPLILRYKDDPRFVALCRKLGLPTPAEIKTEG